jgi:hypothetical protein
MSTTTNTKEFTMNKEYTMPHLSTHGTIGSSTIPACPSCGGYTYRMDARHRKCENCHAVSTLIFIDTPEWHPMRPRFHDEFSEWELVLGQLFNQGNKIFRIRAI